MGFEKRERIPTAATLAPRAVWEGVLCGQWSLLGRSESDQQRRLLVRRNDDGVVDPRALTPRERCVAECVSSGAMNKEVAATLACSCATVSGALSSAIAKLGLASRYDLILEFRCASRAQIQSVAGPASPPAALLVLEARLRFWHSLSPGQRHVAELAARGCSNAEIARLRCSRERTVANQLRSVFELCGVQSRAELLARALSDREQDTPQVTS